jgi:hypothetical protein
MVGNPEVGLIGPQAKLPLENPLESEISSGRPKEKRKPRQGRENPSGPVPLRKSGRCSEKQGPLLDVCQIANALIEQADYFLYADLNEAAARRTRSRVAELRVVALI